MIAMTGAMNVTRCPLDQWDEVLSHFPQHTIFHTRPWLELLIGVHGLKPVLVVARDGDRPVACWPCLWMRKGPVRVFGSPLPGWSTAYIGPLFNDDVDTHDALEAMLGSRWLRRQAYFACKVLDDRRTIDLAPFGFTAVMQFDTYLIDLTEDEDTLWSNLKGECRTRVRKADRLGVEIVEETSRDFADDYWKMCEQTFAKSGIQPTHNRQFVFDLWDRLHDEGRLLVLSARAEQQRIATLVLPYDGHTMYYWGGASHLEFRKIPAHNLLHWTAIKRARVMGLKWYDFISTSGGPGRFKKTFGPKQMHRSTHWERSSSKLMAALKSKYEQYLNRRRQVTAG